MSAPTFPLTEAPAPAAAPTDQPLVSVIIPTRNRARLLGAALRSVLAQTHARLDVIVVDDASADETPAVVAGCGDPRVRYLRHETNRGGAAARNTGIRAASGQYIAFLDDDDEWEPEKTAAQLALLRRYDVVLCAYRGEELGVARRYQRHPTVELDELKHGFFRGGGTSALMARADILRDVMFDEALPRFQDWDLCIRLAQRRRIGYVPRPLVKYNDGDHARISNRHQHLPPAALERELRMVRKHREFFGPGLYRAHMCRFLLHGIRHRPDKAACVAYALRQYGVVSLARALADRLYHRTLQRRAPA